MSKEEWDRLIVTLIEYGGQGRSRSLQGKAKRIVMDAVEAFVQEKKKKYLALYQNLLILTI